MLIHLAALLLKAGDACYLVDCIFGREFMKNLLHVFNFSDVCHVLHIFGLFSIGLFNRLYFNELLMVL